MRKSFLAGGLGSAFGLAVRYAFMHGACIGRGELARDGRGFGRVVMCSNVVAVAGARVERWLAVVV